MKLPVILASEPVATPQTPTARFVEGGGAGFDALAQGLAQFGKAAEHMAQVEDKAQDALARSQATQAHSAFLLGLKTAETDLASVQDPNAIMSQYEGVTRELADAVRGRLSPRALRYFDDRAAPTMAESAARVYGIRNERFKSGIEAARDATGRTELTRAGLASLDDPTDVFEAQSRYFAAVDSDPMLDAARKRDEKQKWADAAWGTYARRLADENPLAFLVETDKPDAGLFRDMPPERRAELRQAARTRHNETLAAAERALTEARKTWRESIQRETGIHLENRTLTQDWLDEYKHAFTDTELRAYRKALEAQKFGGPTGDPDVMQRLRTAAYRQDVDPVETRGRLYTARAADLVNDETWRELSNHLDGRIDKQTAKAENEREKGRQERDKGEQKVERLVDRQHQQVERLLGLAFATTGRLGDFDKVSTEVYTQMLERLARESIATGGKRAPMDIYRQAIVEGVPMVQQRAESRLTTLTDRLGIYKTKAALKAAKGTMKDDDWFELVRAMEEQEGIRQQLLRLEGLRKGAGAGGSAQTPATTAPSSNPRERRQ